MNNHKFVWRLQIIHFGELLDFSAYHPVTDVFQKEIEAFQYIYQKLFWVDHVIRHGVEYYSIINRIQNYVWCDSDLECTSDSILNFSDLIKMIDYRMFIYHRRVFRHQMWADYFDYDKTFDKCNLVWNSFDEMNENRYDLISMIIEDKGACNDATGEIGYDLVRICGNPRPCFIHDKINVHQAGSSFDTWWRILDDIYYVWSSYEEFPFILRAFWVKIFINETYEHIRMFFHVLKPERTIRRWGKAGLFRFWLKKKGFSLHGNGKIRKFVNNDDRTMYLKLSVNHIIRGDFLDVVRNFESGRFICRGWKVTTLCGICEGFWSKFICMSAGQLRAFTRKALKYRCSVIRTYYLLHKTVIQQKISNRPLTRFSFDRY